MSEELLYQAHVQKGLLLNANERSKNLGQNLLEKIQRTLPEILFNRYPDDTYQKLKEKAAAHYGVSPDQVLAGNGSDQMLQVLITTFLKKGKTLLTLAPDFGMYDFYAAQNEANVKKFKLSKEGLLDLDGFIEMAKRERADLVLFSNPNNPTGSFLELEQVEKLCKSLPDTPIVMDEAYVEFAGDSAIGLLGKYKNLYVTRTLSKAYGLAGLRIGFVFSNAENIAKLNVHRPVYNLSSLNAEIAGIILDEAEQFTADISATIQERERMYSALKEIEGLKAFPSRANFIYLESEKMPELLQVFEQEEIAVRDYADGKSARITIGLPEENDRVLKGIETWKEKQK